MDREAWHAAVHGITKSWTQLSNWTELTGWRAAIGDMVTRIQVSKQGVCMLFRGPLCKYSNKAIIHTHTHNGVSSFQHGWWTWGIERHQPDWPCTRQPVRDGWKAYLQVSAFLWSMLPSQPFSPPPIPHSYSLSLIPSSSPTFAITTLPADSICSSIGIYDMQTTALSLKQTNKKNTKIFQHLMIAFSKFIYSYLIDKQCLHPFQSLSVTRNNKTESSFNEDFKFILTRLSEVNKYLTRQNQDIVNTLCKGSFSRNNQIAFKSIF